MEKEEEMKDRSTLFLLSGVLSNLMLDKGSLWIRIDCPMHREKDRRGRISSGHG